MRLRPKFLALLGLLSVASPLAAQQRWRLVEELRVGGEDAGPKQFTWIRQIAVAGDGRIFLLDNGSQLIRLFDAAGRFVRQVGRHGEGPGEYHGPNGMALGPDGKLWVNDPRTARLSSYDSSGKFLRSWPIASYSTYRTWEVVFDARARLLERVLLSGSTPTRARGEVIHRFDPRTGAVDTLALPACPSLPAGSPTSFRWENDKGESLTMRVPFMPEIFSVLDPAERIWCADPLAYRVRAFRLGRGDSLAELRGSTPLIPLPARARDSAVAKVRATATHWLPSRNDPERIPRNYPRFSGLALDDQGQLWLRRRTATGIAADVWSATGQPVATLEMPGGTLASEQLWIRNGKVYAVVLDADEVPTLVRYRIVKP